MDDKNEFFSLKTIASLLFQNLKSLEDLIKNLFATKNNSLTGDDFRLGYMAIVFNTAVFCLSKDLEKLLSDEQFTSVDLFHHEFPFISEAILKIVVRGEGFQDFCIEVLSKAVSKYNTVCRLKFLQFLYIYSGWPLGYETEKRQMITFILYRDYF